MASGASTATGPSASSGATANPVAAVIVRPRAS
jgi:hypothetical protein